MEDLPKCPNCGATTICADHNGDPWPTCVRCPESKPASLWPRSSETPPPDGSVIVGAWECDDLAVRYLVMRQGTKYVDMTGYTLRYVHPDYYMLIPPLPEQTNGD